MVKKIKIAKIKRTCTAFPAQWEGESVNGEEVYIRYRHARLTVEIVNTTILDIKFSELYYVPPAEMSESAVMCYTNEVLEWPK